MATPGLHDYGALLDALRGARWSARLRPRTTNVGAHTAKRIGPNVEVTEYRPTVRAMIHVASTGNCSHAPTARTCVSRPTSPPPPR